MIFAININATEYFEDHCRLIISDTQFIFNIEYAILNLNIIYQLLGKLIIFPRLRKRIYIQTGSKIDFIDDI